MTLYDIVTNQLMTELSADGFVIDLSSYSEALNQLSNEELLQRISDALDER